MAKRGPKPEQMDMWGAGSLASKEPESGPRVDVTAREEEVFRAISTLGTATCADVSLRLDLGWDRGVCVARELAKKGLLESSPGTEEAWRPSALGRRQDLHLNIVPEVDNGCLRTHPETAERCVLVKGHQGPTHTTPNDKAGRSGRRWRMEGVDAPATTPYLPVNDGHVHVGHETWSQGGQLLGVFCSSCGAPFHPQPAKKKRRAAAAAAPPPEAEATGPRVVDISQKELETFRAISFRACATLEELQAERWGLGAEAEALVQSLCAKRLILFDEARAVWIFAPEVHDPNKVELRVAPSARTASSAQVCWDCGAFGPVFSEARNEWLCPPGRCQQEGAGAGAPAGGRSAGGRGTRTPAKSRRIKGAPVQQPTPAPTCPPELFPEKLPALGDGRPPAYQHTEGGEHCVGWPVQEGLAAEVRAAYAPGACLYIHRRQPGQPFPSLYGPFRVDNQLDRLEVLESPYLGLPIDDVEQVALSFLRDCAEARQALCLPEVPCTGCGHPTFRHRWDEAGASACLECDCKRTDNAAGAPPSEAGRARMMRTLRCCTCSHPAHPKHQCGGHREDEDGACYCSEDWEETLLKAERSGRRARPQLAPEFSGLDVATLLETRLQPRQPEKHYQVEVSLQATERSCEACCTVTVPRAFFTILRKEKPLAAEGPAGWDAQKTPGAGGVSYGTALCVACCTPEGLEQVWRERYGDATSGLPAETPPASPVTAPAAPAEKPRRRRKAPAQEG